MILTMWRIKGKKKQPKSEKSNIFSSARRTHTNEKKQETFKDIFDRLLQ